MMSFTWLDVLVVMFLLASSCLAMVRGFVREFMTVACWVGAFCGTVWGTPFLQSHIALYISSDFLAYALSAVIIFMGVFVVSSIFVARLTRNWVPPSASLLDKFFGFVFGFLRGLLLLGTAYLLFSILVAEKDDYPAWIAESWSFPVLEKVSEEILHLLPQKEDFHMLKGKAEPDDDPGSQEGSHSSSPGVTPGYPDTERRSFDQLIETTKSRKTG